MCLFIDSLYSFRRCHVHYNAGYTSLPFFVSTTASGAQRHLLINNHSYVHYGVLCVISVVVVVMIMKCILNIKNDLNQAKIHLTASELLLLDEEKL